MEVHATGTEKLSAILMNFHAQASFRFITISLFCSQHTTFHSYYKISSENTNLTDLYFGTRKKRTIIH